MQWCYNWLFLLFNYRDVAHRQAQDRLRHFKVISLKVTRWNKNSELNTTKFGMWRSPVSVHGWGPCGRRFKSCHPDLAKSDLCKQITFLFPKVRQTKFGNTEGNKKVGRRMPSLFIYQEGLLGFYKSYIPWKRNSTVLSLEFSDGSFSC